MVRDFNLPLNFLLSAEWSKQKEIAINLAEMTLSELHYNHRLFYAEARNKERKNYSRSTLLSLRNGNKRTSEHTASQSRHFSLQRSPTCSFKPNAGCQNKTNEETLHAKHHPQTGYRACRLDSSSVYETERAFVDSSFLHHLRYSCLHN